MQKNTLNTYTNISLDESITKLQLKISAAGFDIVEHSYSNPITNIYLIKISDKNCPLLTTQGSGTSKKEALCNALQSFIEKLSTRSFWSNYYLGDSTKEAQFVYAIDEKWFPLNDHNHWPRDVLNKELREFYNPTGNLNANQLFDVTMGNIKRGICCLPFINQQTDETVYFPINLIDNLYANNGISTGNTATEARIKSLCEIFRNFVQFKVTAEGISLPNIPESVLNKYPLIQTFIDNIHKAGFSIIVKDASLNGSFPVLAVVLLNPNNQGVCLSYCSNPNFELTLKGCFTQLFKYNDLSININNPELGFDMDEISSPNNLALQFEKNQAISAWESLKDTPDYSFNDWRNKYITENEDQTLKQLCSIVQTSGNEIYIADYDDLDSHTCRVIVPGLSEIYPLDDLVWENNNEGTFVRDKILKENKSIEACEQLIEELEDLNLDDDYLVSELIAIPADEKSIFHDLSVAELILLLALKTQDNERMQEGCEWILDYKKINPHRLKTYKCINTILQIDNMANYKTALEDLFTREVLKDALGLIDGEDVFPLESEWKAHSTLIDAYNTLMERKRV